MSETLNEETLNLEGLRKKDKRAFAQLVDQNSDHIYRLALRLTGNPQDAEDVVQETFTKIYLYAASFQKQEGASFSSWAYKILLNTSFNMRGQPIVCAPKEAIETFILANRYGKIIQGRL